MNHIPDEERVLILLLLIEDCDAQLSAAAAGVLSALLMASIMTTQGNAGRRNSHK
jgi:hypothetical protein